MPFIDLHCDTPTVMFAKKNGFDDTSMHINNSGLKKIEKAYQLCAVFTPDEYKDSGFEYFRSVMDYFLPVAKNALNFVPIESSEGGRCIDGDPENLKKLKADYSLRVFGLVHNGENELACGGVRDNKKGLNETGVAAVKMCEDLGMSIYTLRSSISKQVLPRVDVAKTIADYLDTSVDFLLTGKESNEYKERLENLKTKIENIIQEEGK